DYRDRDRDTRGGGGPGGSRQGTGGPGGPAAGRGGRRPWGRRKVCVFCAEKIEPEYKSVNRLRRFLSDRARIESGRKTGTCSRHQRLVRREIKRARFLGLLPFTGDHLRITGTAVIAGARPAAEGEAVEGEASQAEAAAILPEEEAAPGEEVATPEESEAGVADVEPAEEKQ
ncbi:MAG: 30S ribosomal protein S18, partial [Chloroflexi bacterium]|nr:30S ribosomal protein S18 [Chloroflexota bacterium]